jgi:hypothetical protein
MDVWKRLSAFALVLLGTFAFAYALAEKLPGHNHMHGAAKLAPPASSMGGYTLVADSVSDTSATFHLEHMGMVVTRYQTVHEAKLHNVVVRPDLSGFQHIHPTVGSDGRWTTPFDAASVWHLVFEMSPEGVSNPIVVTYDTKGASTSTSTVPLPAPNDQVFVKDLLVTRIGLDFKVQHKDGSPATGFEDYLGMPAHLITIRTSDLAYAHLHPAMRMTGQFMFSSKLPAAGTYEVFLQFGYQGDVLTIPFTVVQP